MTLLNLLGDYNFGLNLVTALFAGNLLCVVHLHYFNSLYINPL